MKTAHDLLTVLARHQGRNNGITVYTLAQQLDTSERQVRALVCDLRMSGHAVCGHPRDGYYIASNAEEMQETIDFLTHRAKHSLTLASRMSNIPMPDLLGQLHVPT